MLNAELEHDERKIIIIERDSGVGWAVAFIVLALAIGFGIIIFMDQQSMVEYKIEQALDRMQESQWKNSPTATNKSQSIKDNAADGLKTSASGRSLASHSTDIEGNSPAAAGAH